MSGFLSAAGSRSGIIGIIGIGNNVSFSVRQNSNLTNKTGANADYTILFDTKISDPGNNYNTGTGLYTAPISGMYYFATMFNMDCGGGSHTYIDAFIKTSDRDFQCYDYVNSETGKDMNQKIFLVADMDAGDTARVNCNCQGGSQDIDIDSTGSWFGGWLIST